MPYFRDNFGQIGMRAARGEDGKTYYVPADMTYPEWKESFVNGGDKAEPILNPDVRFQESRKEFGQLLNNSESTPFNNKMILYNEATEYKLKEKLNIPFAYNPELDVIEYNPSAQNYELYDMNFVQAHELSHRMDTVEYHSWENEKFLQAIENTRKKVYDNRGTVEGWFCEKGKYKNDMALSDIISALSNGEMNDALYVVHEQEYWEADTSHVPTEIFANMVSIDLLGNKSRAEFKGILKELYEAYKEIIA